MEELNLNHPEDSTGQPLMSQINLDRLRTSSRWMNFLSIVAFIGSAFLIILALVILIAGSTNSTLGFGLGALGAVIYLITAILVLFPALYLNRSARELMKYCVTSDKTSLEIALENHKKYWQFIGVLTIIYLVLICLLLLITPLTMLFVGS